MKISNQFREIRPEPGLDACLGLYVDTRLRNDINGNLRWYLFDLYMQIDLHQRHELNEMELQWPMHVT